MFSFVVEKASPIHASGIAKMEVIFGQSFLDKDGNAVTIDRELIYELVANVPGNPMPTGSVGDVWLKPLKGIASSSVTIMFNNAGTFEYTLKVSSTSNLNGLSPASVMSYRVEVTVLKKMSGELEPFVFAFNEDGVKVADPPFVYIVDDASLGGTITPREPTLTPTPTGKPTATPTGKPTGNPTVTPTGNPTVIPTDRPTPTQRPGIPTRKPAQLNRPGTQGRAGGILTGDATKIYTLVALALSSIGVIVLAIAKKRKAKEDEKL